MLHDVVKWRRVDDPRVATLAEGEVIRVPVGERALCFARSNSTLFALADSCPHQGKSFESGTCRDGYLVCPWHQMSFDLSTGRNRFGMTANAEVFPLQERGDGLYVGLPGTAFSLFGIRIW